MIFYLITILLGTIYPIFTEVLADKNISVGPPFYNSVIIPIVCHFFSFMAIGPNIKWVKNKFYNIKKLTVIFFLSIIINL